MLFGIGQRPRDISTIVPQYKGRNNISIVSNTMGTSTDADGGIPTVVQRALGMQSLTSHQNYCNDGASTANNNVICGLEGFLLPRYLALRSGGCTIRQTNDNSSFNMLMRAKNEELQHRVGGHKQQKVASSKSSSRPRKRKRKSDHRGKSNETNTNGNGTVMSLGDADNDIDMQSQSAESDAPTKSKRRKRRRRRKSGQSNTATSIKKDDWLHYQMMARIIVAPFTSSLITTMNKCKQIEKHNQKSFRGVLENSHDAKHTNVHLDKSSSTTSNTAEKPKHSVSAVAVKNVYQKKSTTILIQNPITIYY